MKKYKQYMNYILAAVILYIIYRIYYYLHKVYQNSQNELSINEIKTTVSSTNAPAPKQVISDKKAMDYVNRIVQDLDPGLFAGLFLDWSTHDDLYIELAKLNPEDLLKINNMFINMYDYDNEDPRIKNIADFIEVKSTWMTQARRDFVNLFRNLIK